MGCFNEIEVPCPTCGEVHRHQSKAGSCRLKTNSLLDCELEDLLDLFWDITHDALSCEHCSEAITELPNQVSNLFNEYKRRNTQ